MARRGPPRPACGDPVGPFFSSPQDLWEGCIRPTLGLAVPGLPATLDGSQEVILSIQVQQAGAAALVLCTGSRGRRAAVRPAAFSVAIHQCCCELGLLVLQPPNHHYFRLEQASDNKCLLLIIRQNSFNTLLPCIKHVHRTPGAAASCPSRVRLEPEVDPTRHTMTASRWLLGMA
jgi:hypothetical protein